MEKHFVPVVMLQLPLVLLPKVKTINPYKKTQYILSNLWSAFSHNLFLLIYISRCLKKKLFRYFSWVVTRINQPIVPTAAQLWWMMVGGSWR